MKVSSVVTAVAAGALVVMAGAGAGVGSARVPAAAGDTAAVSACAAPSPGTAACFAQFRSRALGVPASSGRSAAGATGPSSGYGPADIASIYHLDPKHAGQLVAIVDAYDNPHAEKDLAVYRKAWGLPACTTANGCFSKINQRGGSKAPTGDPGWGVEIALDVDSVSAACPLCHILLVEADSSSLDDLGLAVDRAVVKGATIVSNSYGTQEFNGAVGYASKYYNHPGVAMVVSSGDNGFGPAGFPADAPRAIAVGGTTVTKKGAGWAQDAWSGAGSGCSAWFAKPAWQTDTHCPGRVVADVSALADPNTGLSIYDTYQLPQVFGVPNGWVVVGGTSLSAPLIAGMIGLAGNAASLSDAHYLYTHAGALRDVVGGSNGFCGGDYLCTGVVGYDGPTGLGTPHGLGGL